MAASDFGSVLKSSLVPTEIYMVHMLIRINSISPTNKIQVLMKSTNMAGLILAP